MMPNIYLKKFKKNIYRINSMCLDILDSANLNS